MNESIILTEQRDRIMLVTFNNPGVLNALTPEFIAAYDALLDQFAKDDSFDVVILTGSGKAFVAGADIKSMVSLTPSQAERSSHAMEDIHLKMENMDKVFIAAVNGFALGGGTELTLACDLRVASEKAKFGLPEVALGIIPGGGGTQRLTRLVGAGIAKEIVYTARQVSADEAYRIGLVNRVTDVDGLISAAIELANEILKNSRYAVRFAKKAINKGGGTDFETALVYEKAMFGLCFGEPDQREGMTAFIEKRPPNYSK